MKKITIDDIVLATFMEMDVVFHATTLIEIVRKNPQTARTFEGSILRSLRKLRQKGLINYEMKDHNKAQYRKKKVILKISDCLPLANEVLDAIKSVSKQFNQV